MPFSAVVVVCALCAFVLGFIFLLARDHRDLSARAMRALTWAGAVLMTGGMGTFWSPFVMEYTMSTEEVVIAFDSNRNVETVSPYAVWCVTHCVSAHPLTTVDKRAQVLRPYTNQLVTIDYRLEVRIVDYQRFFHTIGNYDSGSFWQDQNSAFRNSERVAGAVHLEQFHRLHAPEFLHVSSSELEDTLHRELDESLEHSGLRLTRLVSFKRGE